MLRSFAIGQCRLGKRGGLGKIWERCAIRASSRASISNGSEGATCPGLDKVDSREEILQRMRKADEYDVLVVGGGATGAGVALDAVTRGLKVAMVEREDFGSGTSSRSTKLLWAGIRYLANGFATLFQWKMITHPRQTIRGFYETFKMVMGCQRERNHLLSTAPHLTNWIPLVVPIDRWILWPPPMKCLPAALGPLGVYWIFFKFYDLLAMFKCPPSYAMTTSKVGRVFPQLDSRLKYALVFYEGQHDDSRTNIAIALTAAENGADVANHTEVIKFITNKDLNISAEPDAIKGAILRDCVTGSEFTIRSKSVVMCGGPFTDQLRDMEAKEGKAKPVVSGAAGTHIVLPGYYCPSDIGMVDMGTSDGRILFYLPWEGHTVVGTTDVKCGITNRPVPTEEEIDWILNETNSYLSEECKVSRKDVLSAWSGIRPLAIDPHAEPDGPVSRDHIVSVNPTTKAVFVAGGKWTTYREMAEDAIDKLIDLHPNLKKISTPCKTLSIPLLGAKGYSRNLSVALAKEFKLPQDVGERIARSYGGRARDVCLLITSQDIETGILLLPGFPYLKAEVRYACREQARTVEDVLSRRTRLSYLNLNAAKTAIPLISEIMAQELGWSKEKMKEEEEAAFDFLKSFAGPSPAQALQELDA
ncbi:hypothetical protein AAMO2058_000612000 [Amorphochlora amoebiformis]